MEIESDNLLEEEFEEPGRPMGVEIDTYAGYTSKDVMYFSSTERVWHNRILKLQEEHPNEVVILKYPKDNDGVIYAKMPTSYLKIQPKKASSMTEEQRQAASERMRALRQKQLEAQSNR